MLRAFFPSTDTTRVQVDADYANTGTNPTVSYGAARFSGTTMASFAGTATLPIAYGLLRDYDSSQPLRVAFDFLTPTVAVSPVMSGLLGTTAPTTTASSSNALFYFTFSTNNNRLTVTTATGREVPFQLQPGEWYHVEMELKVDNSAGYIKVWINNSLKLDVSAIDTLGPSAQPTQVWYMVGRNVGCPLVWDDSGVAGDDLIGYVGDYTPVALTPSADTAQADSTLTGAASRAAALADASTSSYVTFAANADYDLYEFTDTALTGTVKAVVVMADGYLTGNGESYLKAVAKSATVEADSSQQSELLTTGNTARNVLTVAFPTDPNTDAAWSVSAVNAAQFGLKAVVP